jgi:hypothetical protein
MSTQLVSFYIADFVSEQKLQIAGFHLIAPGIALHSPIGEEMTHLPS